MADRQKWEKEKYYSDPKYIIDRKIRTFFKDIIRKNVKKSKYESFLGYSILDFKIHISSLFCTWMSWENYGEWEIDHISPKHNFKYTCCDDFNFKLCWSLNNLRPIGKCENNKRKRGCYRKERKMTNKQNKNFKEF